MGKVMIIDDTPQYLELMATVLASHGHNVVTLSQANGAVEAVRALTPDLLILDLQLGDVSGLDLLSQLRQDKATSGLPVLVCTADSNEGRNAHGSRSDRKKLRVLYKPFDLTAFLSTVSEMIDAQ